MPFHEEASMAEMAIHDQESPADLQADMLSRREEDYAWP